MNVATSEGGSFTPLKEVHKHSSKLGNCASVAGKWGERMVQVLGGSPGQAAK